MFIIPNMGTGILESYFIELWSSGNLKGDPIVVARDWESSYSQPGRYHHTPLHIKEGMDFLKTPEFLAQCDNPFYVRAAWLGHDLHQSPGQVFEADELVSASETAIVYQIAGLSTEDVYRGIVPLIVMTRHSIPVINPNMNTSVIRDTDLWVLGQPRHRYAKYASDIAREWIESGIVMPEDFRRGRIQFLRNNMLDVRKGQIFYTPFCRNLFEEAAIDNINWEISVLESGRLV